MRASKNCFINLIFRLKQISDETEKLTSFTSSTHLDQSVGTISMQLPIPLDKQSLEDFLQKILWDDDDSDNDDCKKKQEIWRLKASRNWLTCY